MFTYRITLAEHEQTSIGHLAVKSDTGLSAKVFIVKFVIRQPFVILLYAPTECVQRLKVDVLKIGTIDFQL